MTNINGSQKLISQVSRVTDSKIVFLVIDGLGGLPHPNTGKAELETANIPNLDYIASRSMCGLTIPVARGIIPGSGPGHLSLFGYDPVANLIKRGVLEAAGIGIELTPDDLAVRGNFCTVDEDGVITDRRAGRLASSESRELCRLLDNIEIEGAKVEVHPVESHRFVIVFRGPDLNEDLADTDDQVNGVVPPPVHPTHPDAQPTADIVNAAVDKIRKTLKDAESPANMVTLRGFSKLPDMPSMTEVYKLSPLGIATYPMYRGLARLVGMKVMARGPGFSDVVDAMIANYDKHDFFFIHYKGADTAGEDGNFNAKVRALEEVDAPLKKIIDLRPDVFIVAGDHSTPATWANHSWHPVPFMMWAHWSRPDPVAEFTEKACAQGVLGEFPATDVMPLALAHAGKLIKFGA